MTQPPKEKSLVVEALTDRRDDYFDWSDTYKKLDKAIRIAEIEHKITIKNAEMLNSDNDEDEFRIITELSVLQREHSAALK